VSEISLESENLVDIATGRKRLKFEANRVEPALESALLLLRSAIGMTCP
jgi:hypothetical protein